MGNYSHGIVAVEILDLSKYNSILQLEDIEKINNLILNDESELAEQLLTGLNIDKELILHYIEYICKYIEYRKRLDDICSKWCDIRYFESSYAGIKHTIKEYSYEGFNHFYDSEEYDEIVCIMNNLDEIMYDSEPIHDDGILYHFIRIGEYENDYNEYGNMHGEYDIFTSPYYVNNMKLINYKE